MLPDKYHMAFWRIFIQHSKINLSHYSHNTHGHTTKHLQLHQHHCVTLNLPLLLHNLPLSQLSSHLPSRWRHLQNISSQTTVCQSKMHHCGITHPAHSPLCFCRCVTRKHFSLNDFLHTSQPYRRSPVCMH